jgi:hypothetical protein
MTYKIAIPSYKRSLICNNQTLKMLHDNGINPSVIYVFVVEQELDIYVANLNPKWYNAIIVGKKGLTNQRDFITSYFNNGDHIISIDDDIINVDLSLTEYVQGTCTTDRKRNCLDDFFNDAFIECVKHKSFIWGIYPVNNKFYREKQKPLSTCLNYIVGAFFGFINRPNCDDLCLHIGDEKEDFERSILYFKKDNIVLRFNKIGFKTKYWGTDGGGMGILKDRIYATKINAEMLEAMYPNYGKIKVRKNGVYEFILKKLQGVPLDN